MKMVAKLVVCLVEKLVGSKERQTVDQKAAWSAVCLAVTKAGVKAGSRAEQSAVC